MGKLYHEVEQIKFELSDILFKQSSGYVNSVGISKVALKGKNLTLRQEESPEDWCISVGLKAQPPKGLGLPLEYKGVRVFYEVIGEIIPY